MGKINKTEIQTKAVNTICEGTTINGDIETKSDIRLDGILKGKLITTGRLVVGNTGIVEGDIFCVNIDVVGKVVGNIDAKNNVSLKEGAIVNGNIASKSLSIEAGVAFDGYSKMSGEKSISK